MNGRVLVVNASLTIRMDVIEALDAAGIRSDACKSTAEVSAALARGSYAVVILGGLIDGEAEDLLVDLRAAPAFRDIYVMIHSAEPDECVWRNAIGANADEFVSTSRDVDHLVARVQNVLRSPAHGSASVVIIDDSQTFRAHLAELFADAGYVVRTAAGGEEGLALVAEDEPTVLIVDRLMPGMDGPAVIQRVQMNPRLFHIPCILMTADTDFVVEQTARSIGPHDVLSKEEDLSVLLDRVAKIARKGSAGRLAN